MPVCILEKIHNHQDLTNLNEDDRKQLCQEIREFLISRISKTGGHVSANLGVVELTVAIETVYDTAKDRLVFDVGHQSYIHKLLTGRQADFDTIRQFGGISGFPKPSESQTDAFTAGHASSSVSIALGMARARTLMNEDYDVVALIGDGAATGGLAYEGLNDAAVSGEPMVVILNDNELSIDRNVGGMSKHLSKLRTKERYLGMKRRYRTFLNKIPGGRWVYRFTRNIKDSLRRMLIPTTIFENMGFAYLGPVDGHDTENLISLLRIAREMGRPTLVHVITQKGKGYGPAEEHPKLFHGIGKFDSETGLPQKKSDGTFSEAFGSAMTEIAAEDPRLCAITAAMPGGTGLLEFKEKYPNRLFDVGIAEGHAVSMCGGLAKQGMVPVFAVYSTFLQRSYDMILQDICLQKLHAILAVDRAGLVGEDGETHHGVFDVGFLSQAPGMSILSPGSRMELRDMLRWAYYENDGPVAIRYPRGNDRSYTESGWDSFCLPHINGAMMEHRKGSDVMIITYGILLDNAMEAASILEKQGIHASVVRLLTIKPLPVEAILVAAGSCREFVVVEDCCRGSGIYEMLAARLYEKCPDARVFAIDLGHRFVSHGSIDVLHKQYGLNGQSIANSIQEVHQVEN